MTHSKTDVKQTRVTVLPEGKKSAELLQSYVTEQENVCLLTLYGRFDTAVVSQCSQHVNRD